MAASEITLGVLSTGIIAGTCVPWGAYRSYNEQKAMALFTYSLTYLLPVLMMLFCYSRIICVLTRKVNHHHHHHHQHHIRLINMLTDRNIQGGPIK